MSAPNLTGTLVEIGRKLAIDTASFLAECEMILRVPSDADDASGGLDPATEHEEKLLQHERIRSWRQPHRFRHLDASLFESIAQPTRRGEGHLLDHWEPQRLERRLAGLVFADWLRLANADGRRPDVLQITTRLLANPSRPHTHRIVTFAVVLGLRSQYGIGSERADLRGLDDAYRSLTSRAGQRGGVLDPCESFLVDVCCLNSFLFRRLGTGAKGVENLTAYYAAFNKFPFGVATDGDGGRNARRRFPVPSVVDWEGELPAFSHLLNLIFNQPLGIPGLDDALGGLRPPFRASAPATSDPKGQTRAVGGGLVTLIAGPAGVGKTTISVAFASRMAEFGADVRYIATEESQVDLLTKRSAVVSERFLADSIWPLGIRSRSFTERFTIHSGEKLETLLDAVKDLISPLESAPPTDDMPARGDVYLDFPYVVVIDSVASLIDDREANDPTGRRNLADVIRRLREARVCVFLVGERQHMNDARLAYLVDNVLTLDLEETDGLRRPVRALSIAKTRHQISHRGKHVFHISRFNGPRVSLALQAILAETADLPAVEMVGRNERQTVLCVPGLDSDTPPVIIPADAHCLLYGWGSSGKAQIALALAFSPTVSSALLLEAETARRDKAFTQREQVMMRRTRILLISFLFPPGYYHKAAHELFQGFGIASPDSAKRMTVLDFYPGLLDPETFVGRIRDELFGAMLRGEPFSAVVIDGIQNMLLQFPRLAREELLWPTLYRLFRSYGIRAISSFTFFSVLSSEGGDEPQNAEDRSLMLPNEAQRMLHHLLVGGSDFGIKVVRENHDRTKLVCVNTATTVSRGVEHFYWDRDTLRFSCT